MAAWARGNGRDSGCTGNGVIELGGHPPFSPPSLSPALKRAGYPFPAR